MGNPILSKRSESIFEDKFNSLSIKDIAIELKHYRIGTAPENPSFVANQEEAKRKIIEKFKDFFDFSMGLELPILISNIGDGKTHFIRMISDAFDDINNVRVRRVYIRDEKVDIKLKILEAVERNEIKKCADKIINNCNYLFKDETNQVAALQDKYEISKNLAITIIKSKSDNVKIHTQALQLLKGNFDEEFINDYLFDFKESSEEFYFDFLKLLCEYLYDENLYIIIVFDEIEHVMDWKEQENQRRFFRNIKELTDKITLYKNLFLILAATQIYGGKDFVQHINLIEPATHDRMKSLFINLKDIGSDDEVVSLIKHLKKRYEKYYSISLDENLVFNKLKQKFKAERVENTYRNYAQEITKIFDEVRFNESDKDDNDDLKNIITDITDKIDEFKMNAKKMWDRAPSNITRKSYIVEAFGVFLFLNNKELINVNRRTGYLIVNNKEKNKELYYVTFSEKVDSFKTFSEKLDMAIGLKKQFLVDNLIYLYPEKLVNMDSEMLKKIEKRGVKLVQYNADLIINLLILLDENISIDYKNQIVDDIKKSGDFKI